MGVFVLTDQHQLVPMDSAQFVTEDEFQSLLEKFPELLSGDTAERDTPERWLLLNREQSVPAEEGAAGRFAIDHLFVDQDAVPTLVEVKRQTDTRLRREVLARCWITRRMQSCIGPLSNCGQTLKASIQTQKKSAIA
jgi:hypothetical protein